MGQVHGIHIGKGRGGRRKRDTGGAGEEFQKLPQTGSGGAQAGLQADNALEFPAFDADLGVEGVSRGLDGGGMNSQLPNNFRQTGESDTAGWQNPIPIPPDPGSGQLSQTFHAGTAFDPASHHSGLGTSTVDDFSDFHNFTTMPPGESSYVPDYLDAGVDEWLQDAEAVFGGQGDVKMDEADEILRQL